jgi:flagellar assembly protein FliH
MTTIPTPNPAATTRISGTATPSATAQAFEAPVLPGLLGRREHERDAAAQSARLRDQGYLDGHAAGWAAAQREVDAALADHRRSAVRLESIATALGGAVAELERRDGVALATIEHHVVALAARLAAEIIGRELQAADEPVLDALARAAALRPDRGEVVIRVHPDDLCTADEAVAADLVSWPDGARVLADPGVEAGGCVVDVGYCRIDAQLGPALERMRCMLDPTGVGEILPTSVHSGVDQHSRRS